MVLGILSPSLHNVYMCQGLSTDCSSMCFCVKVQQWDHKKQLFDKHHNLLICTFIFIQFSYLSCVNVHVRIYTNMSSYEGSFKLSDTKLSKHFILLIYTDH